MPPIARGQTWLFQPLPVSTVPNTGRNQSDSGYRGLDEEVQCQPPGGSRLAPDIEVGTDYLFYFLQLDRAGKKYVTTHC